MSFDSRLVVVALAAFAIANLGGCALVSWLWRRRSASSLLRAEDLRHLRLLPTLVSVLLMSLTSLSFAFFEPRGQEAIGLVMTSMASLAAFLGAGAMIRLIRYVAIGRRAEREW